MRSPICLSITVCVSSLDAANERLNVNAVSRGQADIYHCVTEAEF